ncbi:hypothetical protein C8Q76DRAFT_789089 [Earliella scabrosa]|nr:hypothetical protein C8Q76DRAFT_798155 [Earliella scabrosa]KAI0715196.1 hypothetical protein C8Q76DRAFT_795977 [Earliella scabrosa]KAI0744582.1 hypothetical protein C8Q76DRAFT_789089 [Earliella scabrosa]
MRINVENGAPRTAGPYWVVLSPDGQTNGIHEYHRPERMAIERHPDLLPIVVTCVNYEDACDVNRLNEEIFANAPVNDYAYLHARFNASQYLKQLLRNRGYKKHHCIRIGIETGIWVGFEWPNIDHFTDYKGAKYQGFAAFSDALQWMIEKQPHMSRAPRTGPPSQRILPGTPSKAAPVSAAQAVPAPTHATPASTTPTYSIPVPTPSELACRTSVGTELRLDPASQALYDRIFPPGTAPYLGSYSVSTPVAHTHVKPEPADVKLEQLDFELETGKVKPEHLNANVNAGGSNMVGYASPLKDKGKAREREGPTVTIATLGAVVAPPPPPPPIAGPERAQMASFVQMMMQALPEATAGLRAVIRPLPLQDPLGPTTPAVTFGAQADEWLSNHDIDGYFYLDILRARLYSINRRAFAFTMREMGWSEDDSNAFWDLVELPGVE